MYFDYRINCSDWDYIFTERISDLLTRYNMHKQGILSYGNVYDDLPCFWIEALQLMNMEEQKAIKEWHRLHPQG